MDEALKVRLRQGKVALFLGAGASIGCINALGEGPPIGKSLITILADAMGLSLEGSENLPEVVTAARRRLGADFEELLRKHYAIVSPSRDYRTIATYPWERIYTLNIDDGLEQAFRKNEKNFRLFCFGEPPFDLARSTSPSNLVKLNGSVDRLNNGIIFSENEYASGLHKTTWYETLVADYLSGLTFVFIGTELKEPIFNYHLSRLSSATDRAPAQGYIISPSVSELSAENFRERNIVSCKATTSDFADFLRATLGETYTRKDVAQERLPSFVGVLSKLGVRDADHITSGLYDIVPIKDRISNRSTARAVGLQDFYTGNPPSWEDVTDNVHAQLDFYNEVGQAIERNKLTIIHGSAGCGKTTCLYDRAIFYISTHPDAEVYLVPSGRDFPTRAIRFLVENVKSNILLLVDGFSEYSQTIKELTEDSLLGNLKIVAADRSNIWAKIKDQYSSVPHASLSMRWITRADATRILVKLEEFGDWARMERLSQDQRVQAIYDSPRRQLLVALKEATTGRGFDEIIRGEFSGISGSYDKYCCILLAVATMHGLPISQETFDTAVRSRFRTVKLPRDRGLEGIVLEENGGLTLRHRVIADHLVRRVISRSEVANAIGDIISSQSRLGSPLRQTARRIEQRLFNRIINHEFLLGLFRRNSGMIIEKFEENKNSYKNDFLFWLQFSLFEFESDERNRQKALEHIRMASNLNPNSFQVTNAYCNMLLRMALTSKDGGDAALLMEEASETLENEMRDPTTEPYALTVLALGRVRVFAKWFPEEVHDEAKTLHARLREAGRKYPDNDEITKARNSIPLIAKLGRMTRRRTQTTVPNANNNRKRRKNNTATSKKH